MGNLSNQITIEKKVFESDKDYFQPDKLDGNLVTNEDVGVTLVNSDQAKTGKVDIYHVNLHNNRGLTLKVTYIPIQENPLLYKAEGTAYGTEDNISEFWKSLYDDFAVSIGFPRCFL